MKTLFHVFILETGDLMIWVSLDETTNACGRFVCYVINDLLHGEYYSVMAINE